jgi:hypothetical protein
MSDDLEAIRQLKARYCRFLDNKDWLAWRSLFTDDFVSDTSEAGGLVIKGADNFVSFVRTHVGGPRKTTIHQVHAPELELISQSTAKGIWAFEDFVRSRRASPCTATVTTTRPTRRVKGRGGLSLPSSRACARTS